MYITHVGNLAIPKKYRGSWFMDMEIEPKPVGIDPLTGDRIYFGDGHNIACLLEDINSIPF